MPAPEPSEDVLDWAHVSALACYPEGRAFQLLRDGATLLVRDTAQGTETRWTMQAGPSGLALAWAGGRPARPRAADVLAALEGIFTFHPRHAECAVAGPGPWPDPLLQAGVLLPSPGGLRACRDLLWQQPALWLPQVHPPMAPQYTLSQGRRHPRRPPKPRGLVYQRHIPWLGRTFSFRAVEPGQDLPHIHRWMNDPAVARVWQEEGDLDKHRRYLEAIADDPHMHSMMACLDGQPFGYFEVYWARENRIAPFCDADDYDRGWHVLIGEPAFRGKACAVAWLTSISHFMFLDDPRTRRLVGEPRADHVQQIRNLDRSGYAKVKEFDFPHKRALLVTLLRERFFADALWWPRTEPTQPT